MKKSIIISIILLSVFTLCFAGETSVSDKSSVENEVSTTKQMTLYEMTTTFLNKGNYIQFPGDYGLYTAFLPRNVINNIQISSFSIQITSLMPRWDLDFNTSSYNIVLDEFNNIIITKK